MIALDSSALLAIVLEEPQKPDFAAAISGHDCIIGAPTVLEAQLATMARGGEPGLRSLRFILSRPTIEIAAFSDRHAQSAFDAFDRYGRGRHPAKLNLGDCMAYAVAKLANAPLLYKGGDFALTDIKAALPQGTK